jgi:hypothetical protein
MRATTQAQNIYVKVIQACVSDIANQQDEQG